MRFFNANFAKYRSEMPLPSIVAASKQQFQAPYFKWYSEIRCLECLARLSAPDSDKGRKPLSCPLLLNLKPNLDSVKGRKPLACPESDSAVFAERGRNRPPPLTRVDPHTIKRGVSVYPHFLAVGCWAKIQNYVSLDFV